MLRKLGFLALVLTWFACSTTKVLTPEPIPVVSAPDTTEIRDLDTLVVTGNKQDPQDHVDTLYRSTTTRSFDLLHTRLNLKFDWESEKVLGNARLTLTPYFYPSNRLVLDAKGFTFNGIRVRDGGGELNYKYDGKLVEITLDRTYTKGEKFELEIDYMAKPSAGDAGSAAITSDQGLFFINPRGEEANKPQQIWTQGETEFNSRWFPTIDKPNERSTQETILTVDDKFKTLSNGILKSSTENQDGTRTDHWVFEMPHAPYLFMVGVGDFAVVKDTWKSKEVSYYVEPDYEEDARDIFAHTPEMLTFFSDITGLEYPWPKYAQIVVRDYVSGAMENTTSVIFGDFVQKHKRELIDNHNDRIVAHEMFHHWFGDYVTCESWSNLTLNEGFANYAEYLWFEHKYGRDYADHHRIQEMQGYLFQAAQDAHPLIDFQYEDKENMFDAHSYNKGGLVLHMLRNIVGDEAFFASLNHYLTEHAFESVEVHDLRLAFEKITGFDLNWFFNQWYLDEGHPELEFDYSWSDSTALQLQVKQVQNGRPFKIPTEVAIYGSNGEVERKKITLNSRDQVITLDLDAEPAAVVLDPERLQLATIRSSYDASQYSMLYDPSASLELRTEALSHLATDKDPGSQAIVWKALKDPFWAVRRAALSHIDWASTDNLTPLIEMARQDKHSMVRADAISILGTLDGDYADVISAGINDHDAYPVVASSIVALHQMDEDLAMQKLPLLDHETQSDIVAAISTIYGESRDTSRLAYFDKHLKNIEGLPALDFYASLQSLLEYTSASTRMSWMKKLESVSKGKGISPYTKIASTRTIITLFKAASNNDALLSAGQLTELKKMIDSIIEEEENSQIVSIYQTFMGS